MSDPMGWPDPARPGVPRNPEVDGWHWLIDAEGHRSAQWWFALARGWCGSDGEREACDMPPDEAVQYYVRCEPAHTDADLLAARQEGARAGIEAARTACRKQAQTNTEASDDAAKLGKYSAANWFNGLRDGCLECEEQIRALPLPPPSADALAAVEARVREEEREAIAAEARRYASHYPQTSDGRNTFILLAEWIERRSAAAAIRARTSGAGEASHD